MRPRDPRGALPLEICHSRSPSTLLASSARAVHRIRANTRKHKRGTFIPRDVALGCRASRYERRLDAASSPPPPRAPRIIASSERLSMEESMDEPSARMRLSTRERCPATGIGNEASVSIDPLNRDDLPDVQTSRLSELLRSHEIKGYRLSPPDVVIISPRDLPGVVECVFFSQKQQREQRSDLCNARMHAPSINTDACSKLPGNRRRELPDPRAVDTLCIFRLSARPADDIRAS